MKKDNYEIPSFFQMGKKIGVAVLAIALLFSGNVWAGRDQLFAKVIQSQEAIQTGDADGNGKVELEDASLVLKAALSITILTGTVKTAADVDGNGIIDLSDANNILKAALNMITLPTTQPVSESPAPSESVTPRPTEIPGPPVYEIPVTLPEITADPAKVVTGGALEIAIGGLNGAGYDSEKDLLRFYAQDIGVQLVNPFAGKAELQQTLEEAISLEAEEGKVNCWTLSEASIHFQEYWQGLSDPRVYNVYDPDTVTYTIPKWTNGVTVSFWLKTDSFSTASPILVFENNKAMLMVRANGSVIYQDGTDAYNYLENTAENFPHGAFEEWNYYTVTIANDWVQVYVNGQENLFTNLTLSRMKIPKFNSGFLTRYNSIGDITEADVQADIRKYYVASGEWYWSEEQGRYMYSNHYSVFGNARFFLGSNADGALIMDLLTAEDTRMWIGGADTSVRASDTRHSLSADTRVAGLTYYMEELTAEQISANYAAAKKPVSEIPLVIDTP